MRIAGIDYSITSPAICVSDTTFGISPDKCNFLAIPPTNKSFRPNEYGNILIIDNIGIQDNPISRYIDTANIVISFLVKNSVEKVFIEDYSYRSIGKVFHIAENCAILKYMLFVHGIKFFCIPPTQIKKFATGKGNAKKEDMIMTFKNETNFDLYGILGLKEKKNIPSPIDDIVDSYYICKYGINFLTGEPK